MIDLHCHILPDLDDGAPTLEVALAMAREAVAEGVTTVVATPHGFGSAMGERYSVAVVRERLDALRAALAEAQIPLTILGGTEIYYAADIPEALRAERLLPLGASKAILLECPYGSLPAPLEQLVFRLQIAGYRVVLAHPERTKDVQRKPDLLLPLIERGVLIQLTAEALTGGQGSNMQRLAAQLVSRRLVALIASDAHGLPPRRPLRLAAARDAAAALVGTAEAEALTNHTPAAILADAPLTLPQPR